MAQISPVDPDKYVGTVTVVNAAQVQANLPLASAHPERRALSRGAVGDFVFIDCERTKLLGRITEVKIPDGERLTVEPHLGSAGQLYCPRRPGHGGGGASLDRAHAVDVCG